jgi:hypothetical protein
MNAVARYFENLFARFGDGWNRFWFTPADPLCVSLIRVLTGLVALWFVLSYSADLIVWFGPNGLLPAGTVRQLTAEESGGWNGRFSYLNGIDDPGLLKAVHIAGVLVVASFMIGLATRISSVLTLIVVLSYIHRGPMITGQFEPVLSLLVFYLCFAPCHRHFSIDAWLARRRAERSGDGLYKFDVRPSIAANVSQRLIQVHIAAMYLMMGLTKLGGSDAWWGGEAMWWLIAHTESRLVDLTFLHNHEYVVNLWTHVVVGFELAFGILIWHPLARPLLLAIAVVHWILLGLVTGLLSFSAIMLIANLGFVSPDFLRAVLGMMTAEKSIKVGPVK